MRIVLTFAAAFSLLASPVAEAGTVSGTVVVKKGRKIIKNAEVVVYLETRRSARARRPAPRIRQKGRKFSSKVEVITPGQVVFFPNDDNTAHNVFSPTKNHKFDLGEYRQGTSKGWRFRRTGTVQIRCNIHPQMKLTVKVVDSDYRTKARHGRYTLRNVPQGFYKLVAWSPTSPEVETWVWVGFNGVTAVKRLTLKEGDSPPEVDKYGNPRKHF